MEIANIEMIIQFDDRVCLIDYHCKYIKNFVSYIFFFRSVS